MKINSFKDLNIWKDAIIIAKDIYTLTLNTNNKDFKHDYSLKDQIQRSAVSISANIAEGFDRRNNKEFIYFLKISKASTSETISHLYILKEINYIEESDFNNLIQQLDQISSKIGSLIKYLINNTQTLKPFNSLINQK